MSPLSTSPYSPVNPPPPVTVSLPVPPVTVGVPPPPVTVSLPIPPVTVSLPIPPVTVEVPPIKDKKSLLVAPVARFVLELVLCPVGYFRS